jgi:sugar phosphate isomerase/epimerase
MKIACAGLPLGATLFTLSDVSGFYKRKGRFPGLRDIIERINDMRAEGIRYLEIPLHQMGFFPRVFTPGVIRRAAEEALARGFELSAHVPLPGVQLLSHLEPIRRASIAVIADSLAPLADLPINTFVTHIEGEFYEWMDKDTKGRLREQFLERAFETGVRSIAELLASVPRDPDSIGAGNLVLENLPRTNLTLLSRWAERFNIGVCLDVGHIYLARQDLRRSVMKVARCVRHVHLHDIVEKRAKSGRKYLDDHHAIGSGILDLRTFFALRRQFFPRTPLILEQRWVWAKRSARVLRTALASRDLPAQAGT